MASGPLNLLRMSVEASGTDEFMYSVTYGDGLSEGKIRRCKIGLLLGDTIQ